MKGENEMEIFIQNLAYYNEGRIVGDWFSLNSSMEDLQQFLQKEVKVDGLHEEYFIADYNFDALHYAPSEYDDISLLMKAVQMFHTLCKEEQQKVNAILELVWVHSSSELIKIIDSLDTYNFYQDIQTDYDLGYFWLEESGCYDIPNFLQGYLDYERFGQDIRLESDGFFTSYGYVEAS